MALRLAKCWSVSDRIAVIQFEARQIFVTVINVYAPTSTLVASSPETLHDFYSSVAKVLGSVRSSSSLLYIAGDFNAKLGHDDSGGFACVCNFSGKALVDFCEAHQLFASNTAFKHRVSCQHVDRLSLFRDWKDRAYL